MGLKAHVFVCPRFFSPLCHFDWTVKLVNQFSHWVNNRIGPDLSIISSFFLSFSELFGLITVN